MNNNFTKFLAVKFIDDSESLLAYSEVSGRLFVPNGRPTFFENEKDVKNAIEKTKSYMVESKPAEAKKTQFVIYKLNFSRVK